MRETKNAAGNPAANKDRDEMTSALNGIGTLSILPFSGDHGEAHLLADGPGEETANRMRLLARGADQLLRRDSARPFQQVQDLGRLAAFAGTLRFRGGLRRLLGPGSLLPRRLRFGRITSLGCGASAGNVAGSGTTGWLAFEGLLLSRPCALSWREWPCCPPWLSWAQRARDVVHGRPFYWLSAWRQSPWLRRWRFLLYLLRSFVSPFWAVISASRHGSLWLGTKAS
jgi:hypothetical protein